MSGVWILCSKVIDFNLEENCTLYAHFCQYNFLLTLHRHIISSIVEIKTLNFIRENYWLNIFYSSFTYHIFHPFC